MTLITPLDEVLSFLDIAGEKGFINANTVSSRKTASTKLFEVLDENQKNAEYVRDNLDVIRTKFTHLNPKVAGTTVDEYVRRLNLVLVDFFEWKQDRAAWEKKIAARTAKDSKTSKEPTAKKVSQPKKQVQQSSDDGQSLRVAFPIGTGLEVILPKNFTREDHKRLGYFLLPYCNDFFDGSDGTQNPEWPALPVQNKAG